MAGVRPSFRWMLAVGPVALLLLLGGMLGRIGEPAVAWAPASPQAIVLPAEVSGNFFLVEARLNGRGAFRFLVDTGSTISLLDPTLVAQFCSPSQEVSEVGAPGNGLTRLARHRLDDLGLGAAHVRDVPFLAYDFSELSQHLGQRVDGILGFGVFRQHVLTLDYLRQELVLRPATEFPHGPAIDVLDFDNSRGIPYFNLAVAGQNFPVLIDSGSDGGLSVDARNPALAFAQAPRMAGLVATVAGDRKQYLGRLAGDVTLGRHRIVQPVVDLTADCPTLGGEILRNFRVTFDQQRSRVAFERFSELPLRSESRRSVGLSFAREQHAWAIAGIVPETPAAELALRAGEKCVRINGEGVDNWSPERFAQLLREAQKVTFTLERRNGLADVDVPVVNLVQ